MKESARYAKIVEWSDEDQCYVGSAPGLVFGGCHGKNERRCSTNCVRSSKKRSFSIGKTVNRCLLPPQDGTLPTRCNAWHSTRWSQAYPAKRRAQKFIPTQNLRMELSLLQRAREISTRFALFFRKAFL